MLYDALAANDPEYVRQLFARPDSPRVPLLHNYGRDDPGAAWRWWRRCVRALTLVTMCGAVAVRRRGDLRMMLPDILQDRKMLLYFMKFLKGRGTSWACGR